jgi:ferric iron reductase protein FhuF
MQTIDILLETNPRVILMTALADLMDTTDHSLIFPNGVSQDVTVEVKINGIEVDYVKAFEVTLQEHFAKYDEHIKEKAQELLKEHFNKVINSLNDLEGISDDIINKHCRNLK